MRAVLLVACVGVAVAPSAGLGQQTGPPPADCASEPQPGQTIPLLLDLKGLPAVARGVSGRVTGQVYAEVPISPGGMACAAPPPLPDADVLRGEPSDPLRGGGEDLLRGPGHPRVEITLPEEQASPE